MVHISLHPVATDPIDGSLDLGSRRGNEQPLTFDTGGGAVDGTLETLNAHQGLLRTENGIVPYFWCRAGNELHLWIDGDTHVFELRDPNDDGPSRRTAAGTLGDLTAPMPGVIRKVLVAVGDSVEAVAPLVVMESMKMQISLPAPGAGIITEVLCAEGEMVDLDTPLLRLSPATPNTQHSTPEHPNA